MKRLLILLSILLLTGCSVNYNLEIDGDLFKEEITGNIYKYEFDDISDINGDHNIYWLLHDRQTAIDDEDSFYEQNINEIGDNVEFNYKYNYNNNYGASNILNKCFEKKTFEETNDLYIVHLYGNFYCQYADEIKVNVKTKLAVLDNNANRVEGNNYVWILKNDTNNVDIFMTVSKNIESFTPNNEKSIFTPYRITTLIILIVLVIVSLFIYKKRNS